MPTRQNFCRYRDERISGKSHIYRYIDSLGNKTLFLLYFNLILLNCNKINNVKYVNV